MGKKVMKTLLMIVCVSMILSMFFSIGFVASAENREAVSKNEKVENVDAMVTAKYLTSLNRLTDYLSVEEVEIVNDSFEIYGNVNISEQEFRDIVDNGENKLYFHYRTNRSIELSYDASLQIKTADKTYSYSFTEHEFDDEQNILNGIKSFVEKYVENFSKSNIYELQNDSPASINSDVPTTFIDCTAEYESVERFSDKGYIVYHVAVSKYRANSTSSLYIVSVRSSFVPGQVARNNGDSSYGKYLNNSGYVHMTVDQAYDRNEEYYYGIRWGSVPYKKDYWPLNEPAMCTITSSLQVGLSLGFSFKNGFSTSAVSKEGSGNLGLNISYGYSKAYTQTDPALSVQVDSSNLAKCQWSYAYLGKTAYETVKSETHHMTTYYMFELSNSGNALLSGDFRLKLDYKFVVRKYLDVANPKKLEFSADLMVRAGIKQEIYRFCDGMI